MLRRHRLEWYLFNCSQDFASTAGPAAGEALPTDANDPGVSTARELSAIGESPNSDKGTGVPRVKRTAWALKSRCLPYLKYLIL